VRRQRNAWRFRRWYEASDRHRPDRGDIQARPEGGRRRPPSRCRSLAPGREPQAGPASHPATGTRREKPVHGSSWPDTLLSVDA
jgi:hypothetical protein